MPNLIPWVGAVMLMAGVTLAGAGDADTNAAGDKPKDTSATTASTAQTAAQSSTKPVAADTKPEAKPQKEKVRMEYVTGSFIKRPVRKDGYITDTPGNLSIIDRKAIQQTGAATVPGVLIKTGIGR